MKKTLLAGSLAALMCCTAQADTLLGLYIGGQIWSNDASGTMVKALMISQFLNLMMKIKVASMLLLSIQFL